MSTKYKVIIAALALLVSFAAGRYTVATVTKTETAAKDVNHSVSDADKDVHKVTTVTEQVKPDGTKQITTKTVEDSHATKQIDDSDVKTSDTKTEVTRGASKINLSALAGIDFNTKSAVYGASVTKDLLGPINTGAWGLTNGTVGVSIGLSF